ncbi:MAG: hypothetical protein JXA82_06630 [Sedimentisphaerales bacterium]|nr:hypothetical protein [Sedimentisphaerales bacterium]
MKTPKYTTYLPHNRKVRFHKSGRTSTFILIALILILAGAAFMILAVSLAGKKAEKLPIVISRSKGSAGPSLASSTETKCTRLTNYCLDGQDNILACDGKENVIRVITPEDTLKAVWKLNFSPEAIDHRNDGTSLVSGVGKIALLDSDGKILRTGSIPGITTTGLASTGTDVFAAVREPNSYKYSIYRTDETFSDPKQIVTDLRGCCGQLDIAAKDGIVYLAANCEFAVIQYDREGKEIRRFGSRKQGNKGLFEGCCEPKNVCFDLQGNLYTAESNGCCVKKFTSDGTFLQNMGTASGIQGCVRVTVAISSDNNKIYMLDTTHNVIQVIQ